MLIPLLASLLLPHVSADTHARLVVLNKGAASALVWNLPTSKPAAPILIGVGPHEVLVLADGRTAVASIYGELTPGKDLCVFDLVDPKSVRTIDLGEYRRPHGLALLPEANQILVTCEVNESLIQVDLERGRVVRSWPTGQKASHMVVATRDGTQAYVANIASGSVTRIERAKEGAAAATTIPTGAGSEGLALSPDERELWVANNRADTITVIDTREFNAIATIEAKSFVLRVAFVPDGLSVLATSAKTGELLQFDAKTRKESRRLSLRPAPGVDADPISDRGVMSGTAMPIGMVISRDSSRAYIACTASGTVAVVDLKDWKVIEHLRTAKNPDGIMLVEPPVNTGTPAPVPGTPTTPAK